MIIKGKVQGVFFRARTKEKAQSLGVTGWVQNRADGSVEILATGKDAALQDLIQWCHRGPSNARVSEVQCEDASEQPYSHFEIKHS
jgi:acylphosphatase